MKIAKRCICCDGERLARTPAVLAPFLATRVFGWSPVEITADWGLRDIPTGRAQMICASLECGDCGALFLDMRFDDEEMAALYADYRGAAYTALRDRFEPGYAARNAHFEGGAPYLPMIETFLAPHVPPRPRVLDFGGDTGVNTPFRGRAAAHDIHDISGLPPIAGARIVSLDEARAETYHLVVSIQVLEHVADPAALLRGMAELLGPDTLLYVETPREALMREETPRGPRKRLWHEHVNFFSEAALDAMLARAGLVAVARAVMEVEAGGRRPEIFCLLTRRDASAATRAAA